MSGRFFEVAYRQAARRQYQQLNEEDQATVDRLIASLESDPWPDGETKIAFPGIVLTLIAFRSEGWAIIYRLVDDSIVEIWALTGPTAR